MVCIVWSFLMFLSCMQPQKDELTLLVGTYADAKAEGIYVCRFNQETGEIRKVSSVSGVENPSYIAVSPEGNRVYAVSETDDETAAVYAYMLDVKREKLTFLNALPTKGAAPCYIWVDRHSELVATANYSGGSVTFFPLDAQGAFTSKSHVCMFEGNGPDSIRQTQPHLHAVYADADEKFLFANDLGTDRIYKFALQREEPTGRTVAVLETPAYVELEPGSGPRHSVFHPNGRFVYTIGELSGRVTAFAYEAGDFRPMQSVEADTLHAAGSADIHVSPDGKHLYVSNRLQGDGIAIFSIDPSNGLLTKIGYQEVKKHPRNFVLTPDGAFLLCASRDENRIQVFSRDRQTGLLSPLAHDFLVSKPVCLKFVNSGSISK